MKPFNCLLILLFLANYAPAYASTLPVQFSFNKTSLRTYSHEEIVRSKQQHLTFLKKLKAGLIHLKRILPYIAPGEATPKQLSQGKWSMVLGLLSVVAIFIPHGAIFVIPIAVVAIILAKRSLKGNNNKYGRTGLITGIAAIAVLLAAVAVFAVIYSGGIR